MKKKNSINLTNSQKVSIIIAIIGGTCAVVAAIIGLGTPLVENLAKPLPTSTLVIPTTSPEPTQVIPTATPMIIYKSPKEMNLREGEIPDLMSETIENPDETPLLPEATDQNQRAFKDVNKNTKIETNVYMLPSTPQRSLSEVYDLVVTERRPNFTKTGYDKVLSFSDAGILIQGSDTCGSSYVLIFYRSNIVNVILGCGDDLSENLMIEIASTIDGHITKSPEIDCAQLHLTNQECSNLGTHQYNVTCSVVAGDYCFCEEEPLKTYQWELIDSTQLFSNAGIALSHDGFLYQYKEMSPNNYSANDRTVVFNDNGFIVDVISSSGCSWHHEYLLVK
jgi:hypothetical protein